jgi:Carboxypeptidase regulatory-like domain
MNARVLRTAISVLAGTGLFVSLAPAITPARFSGSIAGVVSSSSGVRQMGATVFLYNRFDRLMERSLTSDKGTFGFDSLVPEVYSIRVSLSSFLPAVKRNIAVQPGMQSMLSVNLASLFSSIELVGVSPGQSSVMSDEWKWVLRSSSSTRPILRVLPKLRDPDRPKATATVFSDTRGLVRVSAGDQGSASSLGSEPDLGTAFAVATSFYGRNRLQVSGNFGYSSVSRTPLAGFRTTFQRDLPGALGSPQVNLTMRQLSMPSRMTAGPPDSGPALRTLSVSVLDHYEFSGSLRLEYGFAMDSVTFLDRLNYASPFARLTFDRGHGAAFRLGYASGTPPPEAFGDGETGVELQQDLSALAAFPRVSLRDGNARVQRTETIEAGYHKKAESRTYSATVYTDSVSNAAVTMAGANGATLDGDLLPDLVTSGWTLNAGQYHGVGYMAAVEQELGSHLLMTLAYGGGPALTADPRAAQAGTLDELRSTLRTSRRQSLTARASGTCPRTGTQFIVSYQWTNVSALNPAHLYLTGRMREDPGFNVHIRQPIPYFSGLPGHLEATADLRNMLAQGYTPLDAGPRRIYLLQVPRSVRGGFSFVF